MNKKGKNMTDDELFLYGDTRNRSIHLMRCFDPHYGHGDHIHSSIMMSEIHKVTDSFDTMNIGDDLSLETSIKPISLTKTTNDKIELEGAIFSGGFIVKFCSLTITMKAIDTINRIITDSPESFWEERTGPIKIDGSEWFLFDKP
jgi:hypothetical protein